MTSIRLSEGEEKVLSYLAQTLHRSKTSCMREALHKYFEEMGDYLLAREALEAWEKDECQTHARPLK